MIWSHITRGGNCTSVPLLQFCMPLLQLDILLPQQVQVLLELSSLIWGKEEEGGGEGGETEGRRNMGKVQTQLLTIG